MGSVCSHGLAAVVHHNDVRAWTELMALPKMVLKVHKRGGKGNRQRAEAETKRLCRSWLEGHRGELWQTATVPSGPRKRQSASTVVEAALGSPFIWDEGPCHERVSGLLKEGLLQRACAALVTQPPAEVTQEVVDEMLSKHPAARESEPERLRNLRRVVAAAAAQVD